MITIVIALVLLALITAEAPGPMLPDRRLILLALPALAACGVPPSVIAPDAALDQVRYRHPGPAALSLYTVRNNGSNQGPIRP